MINGFRRVSVCFWLAAFAILSPTISWAETSQQAVALGRETELIAVRTLAFAGTEGPPAAASGQNPTFHPEEGFQSGTWHLGVKTGGADTVKIFANRAPDVQFVPVFFQIGYTVTDVHGPFPVRGSLEVIFQPTFLVTTNPETEVGGAQAPVPLQFRDGYSVGAVLRGRRWYPPMGSAPRTRPRHSVQL